MRGFPMTDEPNELLGRIAVLNRRALAPENSDPNLRAKAMGRAETATDRDCGIDEAALDARLGVDEFVADRLRGIRADEELRASGAGASDGSKASLRSAAKDMRPVIALLAEARRAGMPTAFTMRPVGPAVRGMISCPSIRKDDWRLGADRLEMFRAYWFAIDEETILIGDEAESRSKWRARYARPNAPLAPEHLPFESLVEAVRTALVDTVDAEEFAPTVSI
jgi:hypothetical protein